MNRSSYLSIQVRESLSIFQILSNVIIPNAVRKAPLLLAPPHHSCNHPAILSSCETAHLILSHPDPDLVSSLGLHGSVRGGLQSTAVAQISAGAQLGWGTNQCQVVMSKATSFRSYLFDTFTCASYIFFDLRIHDIIHLQYKKSYMSYVIYAFECIWDMSLRCNIRKGQADKVGWRASQGKLNWVRPAGDGLRVPTSYWYMQNRCPVQTDSLRGKINQRITRRKTDQRDGCQPISQCSVLDIRASEHGCSSTKRPENGFDPSPNQNTSWCWNCLRAARNTPRQMMFKQISKNRDAPAKNCSSFYQK